MTGDISRPMSIRAKYQWNVVCKSKREDPARRKGFSADCNPGGVELESHSLFTHRLKQLLDQPVMGLGERGLRDKPQGPVKMAQHRPRKLSDGLMQSTKIEIQQHFRLELPGEPGILLFPAEQVEVLSHSGQFQEMAGDADTVPLPSLKACPESPCAVRIETAFNAKTYLELPAIKVLQSPAFGKIVIERIL